jgi:Tol biopolymer transport system component
MLARNGPLRRVDSSQLGVSLEASRSPGLRDGHDAWIGAISDRKVPMRLDSALLTCSALVALASGAAATQATTTRLSVSTAGVQGNSLSFEAWISADGRFVAFQSSATNLVAGDTNSSPDVFVRDIDGGVTERVSVATGGAQGNSGAVAPAITSDGRFVAFAGYSSNFVAGDANGVADIFVRDRQSGTTECASVATGGALGNGESNLPSLSADGRFAVFDSYATNLVAGDTNGMPDIFLRDRLSGTTERISVATGGTQSNEYSTEAAVSLDGRFVVFHSGATNLMGSDTNFRPDVFVRDRLLGTTTCISNGSVGGFSSGGGSYASMSSDGRFIAYHSDGPDLVPGDTNFTTDVFVHDRLFGSTERASVDAGGVQANAGSHYGVISASGAHVAFVSYASNLGSGDTNGTADVYARDRIGAMTERMSVSTAGVQNSSVNQYPAISSDGRRVVFESPAFNLVAGDTNNQWDVFLRERGAPQPVVYCTAGTTSNGCTASIAASANPSASLASPCNITVVGVEGQKLGLVFYGVDNAGFTPLVWTAGSTSFLCVKPPTQRTAVHSSGGSAGLCNGTLGVDWNAFQIANPAALGNPWSAGNKVFVQAWFRDPPAPKTTHLSNAVELTYQP